MNDKPDIPALRKTTADQLDSGDRLWGYIEQGQTMWRLLDGWERVSGVKENEPGKLDVFTRSNSWHRFDPHTRVLVEFEQR